MKRKCALLAILFASSLFPGLVIPAQETEETYVLWGDPQKGRKVYADRGCASCHAIKGVGGTLGPDLGRPPSQHRTVTQMAEIMWKHAVEMEQKMKEMGLSWPRFEKNEMVDLITYVRSVARPQKP